MRGKVLTVMRGSDIAELDAEILGVQKDGIAPGRDLIIGKLVDPLTQLTGAAHGMSGSPLHINGKLAGALSRRLAMFEKDGHCGFTPIEDMLDVGRRSLKHPDARLLAKTSLRHFGFLEKTNRPDRHWLSLPLAVSGWQSGWEQHLSPLVQSLGFFTPSPGGSVDSEKKFPLKPGSPLSAVLISGDISVSATGTLTTLEDGKFLAFGHPMTGLGEVGIPAASAEIVTVLPSYATPFKIANTGAVEGVILQDRLSAVSGEFHQKPSLASYQISRMHQGEPRPEWRGGFVADPNLAPGLLGTLFLLPMMDIQDASTDFTMVLDGELKFENLPPLELGAVYSGNLGERVSALWEQMERIQNLFQTFFKELRVEDLTLLVQTVERSEVWGLEDFQVSPKQVKSHATVTAVMTFRNLEGEIKKLEHTIALPEEIREGVFAVRAVSGGELTKREQKNIESTTRPSDAIQALNRSFDRNSVFLEIVTKTPGAEVRGEAQSGLPVSILNVFKGGNRSDTKLTFEKVWVRKRVQLSGVVRGSSLIPLERIR